MTDHQPPTRIEAITRVLCFTVGAGCLAFAVLSDPMLLLALFGVWLMYLARPRR